MVEISAKTYENNGVEVVVDNNRTLWLNEKHIEERLHYKNSPGITWKYHPDFRKCRYEIVDEPKKATKQNILKWKISIKFNKIL